ncbi:twin-arginine translocation signal domain-containing protein [Kutzneria kofuensis]|uniref:Uncharacterized protein n=1 Tax=Kutzneria kofuensis TaxID=103725 RepID=A0A7W9NGE8_9PSEU|nr:twin-arginine translocation signal domain-containing protein [Kutzneria kofuensis]MBB5891444.1 hypothetical protein [Kutzneria kofuensis]
MPFPRRTFLAGTGATAAAAGLGVPSAATPTTPSADLHWMDGPPPAPSGTAVPVPVDEIPTRGTSNPAGDFATFATNDFAQRTLAYIALLAIAPQEAP